MTDQSVTERRPKEKEVAQERKQHLARMTLRKLVQEKGAPEALSDFVEHFVHKDLAQREMLEEIAQCFLMIRSSFKQEAFPAGFPALQLIEVFQRLAQKRNISSDQLYLALLEKVVEGDVEDVGRMITRPSTRDKILNAALDVFSEKGFHLSTVDEIAEQAGVGKGTLYRYFVNKETLFNELVRIRLEELEKSVQAVLDGQDDVLTMIVKYLRAYFEFFDRNRRLYSLIMRERLDVGEQVQDFYVKKVMRRIPILKRKIYEASQQGILKDVDFQTVFYGVMGFIHGVMQKWLASDCAYSLVEELPAVTEVLFYGFVKSQGVSNGD
jgi:AcrR family transcriptional regulator